MTENEASLHRTLVHFMIESKHAELAAAILDGEIETGYCDFSIDRFYIDIPPSAFPLVAASQELQDALIRAFRTVNRGHAFDQNGNPVDKYEIVLRMKLLPVDENWKELARNLIVNRKGSNQALVSEICASRDGRPLHTWNELKYASASEIRIAQELEKRQILFFPLAVAVRADTGQNWKDHREVDFLICRNGAWGILEVAFHPDRYEKDSEKDYWLKKSGILCIQHYTAERCYNQSAPVVDEFLSILQQHEKL
jgi:hypothetical protein